MYVLQNRQALQLGKSKNCNNEDQDMRTIKKRKKKSTLCKLALKTKE